MGSWMEVKSAALWGKKKRWTWLPSRYFITLVLLWTCIETFFFTVSKFWLKVLTCWNLILERTLSVTQCAPNVIAFFTLIEDASKTRVSLLKTTPQQYPLLVVACGLQHLRTWTSLAYNSFLSWFLSHATLFIMKVIRKENKVNVFNFETYFPHCSWTSQDLDMF